MGKLIYGVASISFDEGLPKKKHVVKFMKNNPNEIDIAFKIGEERHVNVRDLHKYKFIRKIRLK